MKVLSIDTVITLYHLNRMNTITGVPYHYYISYIPFDMINNNADVAFEEC
jgi:DNA-binding GntR family transcriptional regulator